MTYKEMKIKKLDNLIGLLHQQKMSALYECNASDLDMDIAQALENAIMDLASIKEAIKNGEYEM